MFLNEVSKRSKFNLIKHVILKYIWTFFNFELKLKTKTVNILLLILKELKLNKIKIKSINQFSHCTFINFIN
jgi:hypothetical protein